MKREYEFYNATPLLQFVNQYKNKIVGQHVLHFYSGEPFGQLSAGPIAFELDDFSIIVTYYFYSDIVIDIVDTQMLKDDLSLNFLYKDIPESRELTNWVREEEFPYSGQMISDILIKRFSHEFEINPSTGETRPDGGDYFSVITIVLSNGEEFHICAAEPICDGYVETW